MQEQKGAVTMHGSPLTLVGTILKVGDRAPEFTLLDNELKPVTLSSMAGRTLLVSTVPSLDTPVCDLETQRFNTEAGKLGDTVSVLTVSMDLPFAQKRWCGAAGVKTVITLSDHLDANFGLSWGVLIKELRLLARAVFVVDPKGRIVHVELVKELANEPDYDAALNAARSAAGK